MLNIVRNGTLLERDETDIWFRLRVHMPLNVISKAAGSEQEIEMI